MVTLIAAGVLYAAATSSVKGFALMLLIGVITSIFTAVVFTRAMLGVLSGFPFMTSPRVLGAVGTGDRWKSFDFIGKKRHLVLDLGRGAGGRRRSAWAPTGSTGASTSPAAASSTSRTKVALGRAAWRRGAPITGSGIDRPRRAWRTSTRSTRASTYTQFQVQSHFLTQSTRRTGCWHTLGRTPAAEPDSINLRNVSSSFGQSVLDSAYLAVLFSLIIIFIYVWFRFEWMYAVPVMVALGARHPDHDRDLLAVRAGR